MSIPEAGAPVTALPYGTKEDLSSEELLDHDPYDGPKDPIEGLLEIIKVPADYDLNSPSYILYLVNGTPIDSTTITTQVVKASIESFSNPCHSVEDGRFCETDGGGIRNFGLDDWPEDRRNTVLNTISRLNEKYGIVKKYGVEFSVNASGVANSAIQMGALAAVDGSIPTHIDIHPELGSQEYLEANDPGTTVSTGNLEHVIIHEFGHTIESTIPERLRKELTKPFEEAQQSLFDLEDGIGNGEKFQDLIMTVSRYAGDNVNEGIAEAFLQHELGVHNKFSDHVGEVISRWKEKGVKR